MGSFCAAVVFAGCCDGNLFLLKTGTVPPAFFASCCAKYCLRLTSKSGSCRYSSSEDVKLVGACFMFGICNRVEGSTERACCRYSTTSAVCLVKTLYISKARSAS